MKQVNIPYFKNIKGYTAPVSGGEVPKNGVVTLTQCNAGYSPKYDVETDCMLCYVYGIDNGGALESWAKNKHTYNDDTTIGLMVAINRDSGEYIESYAGDRGLADVQTLADGSYRKHSQMGNRPIYYMVPTPQYVEYKWKAVKHFLDTGLVNMIAFEEPEFWNSAGYSKGFKEVYEATYNTHWEPPETSADVKYKTQKLKAQMFVDAIDVLSRRIKEYMPSVQVLVATHCVDDYCAHGISTNLHTFGNLPCVDGFIGQTWSDGVCRDLPCEGELRSFSEGTALFQYRSYRPFLKSHHSLYFLQDPSSDNPHVNNEWRIENWRKTVVASMLQDHSVLSQFTIWPQRAFMAANPEYRTTQLNVYKLYQEMDKLKGNIYSGTTGIALGLSDTASWCIEDERIYPTQNLKTIFGFSLPLLSRGMPIDTVCLDTLDSVDILKDVKLLLLSYDGMKPLGQKTNEVIADYVKQGGRVLYFGGYDRFNDMKDIWWSEQNTTPLEHLLSLTGKCITAQVGVSSDEVIYKDEKLSCTLGEEDKKSTVTFKGEIAPLATVNGETAVFSIKVGNGEMVVSGLPSAFVSSTKESTDFYLDLCKKLLPEYSPCQIMAAVRDRYISCCALEEAVYLDEKSTLLDLFSHKLTCLKGGVIAPHTTGVYYDVTDLVKGDRPRFLFTGGVEVKETVENDDGIIFTITQPEDSVSVSRVYCGGKNLTVNAVNSEGDEVKVETEYDQNTDTLALYYYCENINSPVTFTIK